MNSTLNVANEIVIVDTGSIDKTIQIIKEVKGDFTLHLRKPEKNYGKLRNLPIQIINKKFSGDNWILSLDGDERLSKIDSEVIRHTVDKYNGKNTVGGIESIKNHYTYGGWFSNFTIRLFKNNQNFKYEGKIFEDIRKSIEKNHYKITSAPFIIHDFGLRKKPACSITKKLCSYLSILIREMKEKSNFKQKKQNYLYLSYLYSLLGKHNLALKILESKYLLHDNLEKDLYRAYIYYFTEDIKKASNALDKILSDSVKSNFVESCALNKYGNISSVRKDYKTALSFYTKAMDVFGSDFTFFNTAVCYFNLRKREQGIKYLKRALKINPLLKRINFLRSKNPLDTFNEIDINYFLVSKQIDKFVTECETNLT